MTRALLSLLLACSAFAAAPGYRRVADARLWFSAELPSSWEAEGAGTGAFKPKAGSGSGITVSFFAEGDALKHVRDAADPSSGVRDARRIALFRGSAPEHRGQWVVVETFEKNVQGAAEYAAQAALPAPGGGFYSSTYWAVDETAFKRGKPAFEHWLDTFKREPPALRFEPYKDDELSLEAPGAPWSREKEAATGETLFLPPAGPGEQSRGLLKIQRFGMSADQFAKSEGASKPGHKAAPITRKKLPAGDALTWDVEVHVKDDPLAERRTGDRRELYRWAVLERRGGCVAVSWSAPPASFENGLPAFERALKTLRFSKP
jgi:hypothetical protein